MGAVLSGFLFLLSCGISDSAACSAELFPCQFQHYLPSSWSGPDHYPHLLTLNQHLI